MPFLLDVNLYIEAMISLFNFGEYFGVNNTNHFSYIFNVIAQVIGVLSLYQCGKYYSPSIYEKLNMLFFLSLIDSLGSVYGFERKYVALVSPVLFQVHHL